MNTSKTTLTAIAGFFVTILAYFGFHVSPETIAGILTFTVMLIGIFAQDAGSEDKTTPHGFVAGFSPTTLLIVLPMILEKIAQELKKKDKTGKGWLTAAGNLLIAFSPVIAAIVASNETGFKKALRAARDTINNYLGE